MAKTVKEMPVNPRRCLYDWSKWLDGRVWELTEGEDYGPGNSIRATAYSQAAKRQILVTVRRIKNKIFIQAHLNGKKD